MGLNLLGLPRKFNPHRISPGNLKLWLDATRITGLNDGDAVTTWSDVSGNSNNATQSTAGNKPLYKTNIQNSRPVVRFDGTDDFLLMPMAISDAMTVFIVHKVSSLGAGSFASLMTIKNTTFSEWTVSNAGAGYRDYGWRHDMNNIPGAAVGLSDIFDTNWHILTASYNNGTNTAVSSYTGALDGGNTVVANGNYSRAATDKGSIGARVDSTDVTSLQLNGDIAEILVYGVQLSKAQRRKVERYLSAKWSITRTDIKVEATFTATDSSSALPVCDTGQSFTVDAGTIGVSSNRWYSVTDTDGDMSTLAAVADGDFYLIVTGDLNGATDYRFPRLVFRKTDNSNFLAADLYGGNARLRKMDAASESSLATAATTTTDATDYVLQANGNGNTVKVYKDGTLLITHTLSGGDTKYAAYTDVGIRLAKGGTPTSNARADNLIVEV